jgi:hypothetical protein
MVFLASNQTKDLETTTVLPHLKLVRTIRGDSRVPSMVKKKLPSTNVTHIGYQQCLFPFQYNSHRHGVTVTLHGEKEATID